MRPRSPRCWATGNYFHDNNNRDVPGNGLGLLGVGFLVAGGRNDTITGNRFARNGAWAAVLDFFFTGVENGPADCTSGGGIWNNPYADAIGGGPTCFFTDFGSHVSGNVFVGNGFFGQPTNGDLADLSDFSAVGSPAPARDTAAAGTATSTPPVSPPGPSACSRRTGTAPLPGPAAASPARWSASCSATICSCRRAIRCASARSTRSRTRRSRCCPCPRSRPCPTLLGAAPHDPLCTPGQGRT
jgi:hypothetical protein